MKFEIPLTCPRPVVEAAPTPARQGRQSAPHQPNPHQQRKRALVDENDVDLTDEFDESLVG